MNHCAGEKMQIKRLEECPSYRNVAVYCIMLNEHICGIAEYTSSKSFNRGQLEKCLTAIIGLRENLFRNGYLPQDTLLPFFNLDTLPGFVSTAEGLKKEVCSAIDAAWDLNSEDLPPKYCYVIRHVLEPNLVAMCVCSYVMDELLYTKSEKIEICES
jgi:hypothetical protein